MIILENKNLKYATYLYIQLKDFSFVKFYDVYFLFNQDKLSWEIYKNDELIGNISKELIVITEWRK